jgi:glycerol-3-phosphate dehydrogenase
MEEVDYLLEVADHHVPAAGLGRQDVISAQAGLRPLIAEPGKGVEDLSRRERLIQTPSGVLAVGGGKLTTYRPIAEKVVDAVMRDLAERGAEVPDGSAETKHIPLNRRIDDAPVENRSGVSGLDDAGYLEWAYGADAGLLSGRVAGNGARALLPGRPYIEAEIEYAMDREMAVRLADFMSQRLRCLLIDEDQGMAAAERVATIMGHRLGWDERQHQQEVAAYRQRADRYSLRERDGSGREAG